MICPCHKTHAVEAQHKLLRSQLWSSLHIYHPTSMTVLDISSLTSLWLCKIECIEMWPGLPWCLISCLLTRRHACPSEAMNPTASAWNFERKSWQKSCRGKSSPEHSLSKRSGRCLESSLWPSMTNLVKAKCRKGWKARGIDDEKRIKTMRILFNHLCNLRVKHLNPCSGWNPK